jgi:hypothetical protein
MSDPQDSAKSALPHLPDAETIRAQAKSIDDPAGNDGVFARLFGKPLIAMLEGESSAHRSYAHHEANVVLSMSEWRWLQSCWMAARPLPHLSQQLPQFLIETHHRASRVKGLLIEGEHMLHPFNKGRGQRRNTPTARPLSGEMLSTIPSSISRVANSSNVQRSRPAGAGLQLNAMRYACCCSFSFASGSGRSLSSSAARNPASLNRTRIGLIFDHVWPPRLPLQGPPLGSCRL